MSLQKLLLASLTGVLLAGAARAVPVIADANFSDVDTSTNKAGAVRTFDSNGVKSNVPGWTANMNAVSGTMSFSGQSQFNVNGYWNNGALPAGTTVAGFLANRGDSISQAVSGFTVGDTYQISLLANARSGQTGTPQLTISVLGMAASNFTLVPVDTTSMAVTAFQAELYSFTAQSGTETIMLAEDAASTGGSVLLSGLQIADLTTPVPEPLSLALLVTGLASLGLVRRRG